MLAKAHKNGTILVAKYVIDYISGSSQHFETYTYLHCVLLSPVLALNVVGKLSKET